MDCAEWSPLEWLLAGTMIGVFVSVSAVWMWYHYWPTDRTKDARNLAREHRKKRSVREV